MYFTRLSLSVKYKNFWPQQVISTKPTNSTSLQINAECMHPHDEKPQVSDLTSLAKGLVRLGWVRLG